MAGKGSRQRPTNMDRFGENYDRIFGDSQVKCLKDFIEDDIKEAEEEVEGIVRKEE